MTLNFQLSYRDFKNAFNLHRRQKFLKRFSILLWPLLTILFLALAMCSNPRSGFFAQFFAMGVTTFFASIGLPFLRSINARKCYRRFLPKGKTNRSFFSNVDEECVITGVSGVMEMKYFWEGIVDFAQDEKSTLFYTSNDAFLFLPTQAMTKAQRAELNDLIARHVTRKKP
jgi:hypothetical protein